MQQYAHHIGPVAGCQGGGGGAEVKNNQGCIQLSRNPVSAKTSKHIAIRYHFIRERVMDGTLKLAKIDTKLNTADILTKATRRGTFIFLRDKLLKPAEKPKWRRKGTGAGF